jgi:hypothetical protein
LKQSLKDILHYNNCDLANLDALYLFEDRPRVMIDGKSISRRFAILSSKEKNKLPPKSNKNVSCVIIDVLPSTIIRNLKTSIESSLKRSTVPSTESSSPAAKRIKPNSIINTTDVSEDIVDEAPTCTTNKDTDDDTFWNLPEARHLFGYMNPVNYEEEEEDAVVEEIIVRRLEAFHKAHLDAEEGYKVLEEDSNFNNNLTSHQILLIRQKCKYLYHSLCIALELKSNML